jgi:hypothetical protein
VKCGNQSNTHLYNVGFKNVFEKFKEKTGMQYTRMQFKDEVENSFKDAKLSNVQEKDDFGCDNVSS